MTTLLILLACVAVCAVLWTPDKPAAELEARYTSPASQFIETTALRLHIQDTGPRDAPVVVMLHGLGASLHAWEPWAEALTKQYRVIRYDLPGFGLTGADVNVNYSPLRSIAVLSTVLNLWCIRRVILVGHGIGGELAWQFASRFPERVEKLVLISPCGVAYDRTPKITLRSRLLRFTMPTWWVWLRLRRAYGNPRRIRPETVRRYRDLMLTQGNRRELVIRIWMELLNLKRPKLDKVVASTLLLWGERDRLMPLEAADRFLQTLPNASLVVLPGLGHMPHEEDPAAALVPVEAFLAQ